jgi:hypothetical protein
LVIPVSGCFRVWGLPGLALRSVAILAPSR